MSDVQVFEGFDLVGKTTLARMFGPTYRPDYGILDSHYDRSMAFMFGYAQADMWLFCRENGMAVPKSMVLDRGPVSSYVYSRVDPDQLRSPVPIEAVLAYFEKLLGAFDSVTVNHVRHADRMTAERMYLHSRDNPDGDHEEDYDRFAGFGDYWRMYGMAEERFSEVYRQVGDHFAGSRKSPTVKVWSSRPSPSCDGLNFGTEDV